MNLLRTLGSAALIGLSGALGLSSCLNKPDYANTPEIEFKEVKVTRILPSGGNVGRDTLEFVLSFKDGDGDLGLDEIDLKSAPYNTTTGGHNNNGYGLNYFIQPYKKVVVNGVTSYKLFTTPAPFGKIGEYDSRYPRLNGPDGRAAPLTGTLRYKLPLSLDGNASFPGVFNPGDVFRFEISILDRALHQSNVITTSDVTL